jgi:hypothetical protein
MVKFIEEVKKVIKKLSIGLEYQNFEAYYLVFGNLEYHYIGELVKLIKTAEPNVKKHVSHFLYKNNKLKYFS